MRLVLLFFLLLLLKIGSNQGLFIIVFRYYVNFVSKKGFRIYKLFYSKML